MLVDLCKNYYGVFRGRIKRSKEKWGEMRPETGEIHLAKESQMPMARGDHRS